jgi:hypothetical protein
MNKNKILMNGAFLPALLLATSFGSQAYAESNSIEQGATPLESATTGVPLPADVDISSCEQLSDQVHRLVKSLESKEAVHCYVFTAVRGQKILLATPEAKPDPLWQVEYYDGAWKSNGTSSALALPDLKSGDQVAIRVSYKQEKPYQNTEYKVAFGSYPVLKKASLTAPTIRNRVPVGDSGWASGLQTHGALTFEAKFTDSTGAPLKGALAYLSVFLTLESESAGVKRSALSDERGIATQTFKLDRCYGGERVSERNDANGTHYWTSAYNVGRWFIFDGFIGNESEVNESRKMAGFAHICSQTLKRGRVDRF